MRSPTILEPEVLRCGCFMDPFAHDGGCQKVHLMEKVPSAVGHGFTFSRPLCGMDAYKVNFSARVFRSAQGGIFMSDPSTPLDNVCLVCMEEATHA